MSTFSSNGETVGVKALFGVVVVLSAALLYAAMTPVVPRTAQQPAAVHSVSQVETVVVAARSGERPS